MGEGVIMAELYVNHNGANAKVKELYVNYNGSNTKVKELYESNGTSWVKIFNASDCGAQQYGTYSEAPWAEAKGIISANGALYLYASLNLSSSGHTRSASAYVKFMLSSPISYSPSTPIISSTSALLKYYSNLDSHYAAVIINGEIIDITGLMDNSSYAANKAISIYPTKTGQTDYVELYLSVHESSTTDGWYPASIDIGAGNLYINGQQINIVDPIISDH